MVRFFVTILWACRVAGWALKEKWPKKETIHDIKQRDWEEGVGGSVCYASAWSSVCVAQACRLIQWVLSSLNGTVGLCSDYPCRPQMIASISCTSHTVMSACLPACVPACLPACLPAHLRLLFRVQQKLTDWKTSKGGSSELLFICIDFIMWKSVQTFSSSEWCFHIRLVNLLLHRLLSTFGGIWRERQKDGDLSIVLGPEPPTLTVLRTQLHLFS